MFVCWLPSFSGCCCAGCGLGLADWWSLGSSVWCFAVFIGVLFGGGYFRDKPARGNIGRAHTPDEYITLKQLQLEVKIFKETIRQVCLI
jgi:hypothetical protein